MICLWIVISEISKSRIKFHYEVFTDFNASSTLLLIDFFHCRLVQHTSDFVKFATTDFGISLGVLLCEIYQGGPSLCLALENEDVQKLIQIILSKKWEKQSEINCTLAQALQELILVRIFSISQEYSDL